MRIGDVAFHHIQKLDAGTLDASLRSPAVLKISADTPAAEAARMAEEQQASLIVVTEGGDVSGIVAPAVARERIGGYLGSKPATLRDALAEMQANPYEAARGYHHEGLNEVVPELFTCPVGPHYTDEWPCRYPGH